MQNRSKLDKLTTPMQHQNDVPGSRDAPIVGTPDLYKIVDVLLTFNINLLFSLFFPRRIFKSINVSATS